MDTATFYRAVMKANADRYLAETKRGTAAVFRALRDRLSREEAGQVAAQLPQELKAVWRAGERPGRKLVRLHRRSFYERVMNEADLRSLRDARWMTLAVLGALKEALSLGEAEDVLAQLPKDLKELWTEARIPA
jgi:uncharacterized protein (DUF2267 family)